MFNEKDKEYVVEENELLEVETIYSQKQPKRKPPYKKFVKWIAAGLVFGLVAGGSFQAVNTIYGYVTTKEEVGNNADEQITTGDETATEQTTVIQNVASGVTAIETSAISTGSSNSISDVVESVMPSIVSISSSATTYVTDMFGRQYSQDASGSGSGIIIGQNEKEVLIVTNNHVVEDANSVEITFADETVANATIKGTDSSADLAVVSVELDSLSKETKANIKVAVLGDSEAVKLGQMAIAIGNALGYGQSVTVGYISATNREIAAEDYNMALIQTDAAINPGNSGGALLNANGEVIGINSVKYASEGVEGMGFAIPISTAVPIINDLMNRESIPEEEQAYLGIMGQDVTETYSERYNMPVGVYVNQVTEDSPAEQSGLLAGDIIVQFDNKKIASMTELQDKLSYTKAGKVVEMTVKRLTSGEYVEKTLTVTLGNKVVDNSNQTQPETTIPQQQYENNQQYGMPRR